MADEGKTLTDKKVYHTAIGDFTEIQPKVYVSGSFDQAQLAVPEEVSGTKQARNLHIDPNTVFINGR